MRGLAMVFLFLCAVTADAKYAGRPLRAALGDLQSRGLKLIYSDDVVRAEMIVRIEPRPGPPRRILDELLREHHLRARAGPRDTLLIVRREGAQTPVSAPLEELPPRMPVALAEIVVTPSRYTILAETPESRQFLDRDDVRRLPHLADDVYRAIARVPGTSGPDVSARFHLRGGAQDEVMVLVDGAEIYDPFHVKDLFRAFSTIDAEAVGSVDILSGGYPVEYGGRMSGVVDISTLAPRETRNEAGIGLLTARALSQGTFGGGRGSWLLSARRGYLREALQIVDETSEINPRYYDILGKVEWILGTRGVVSAHLLAARDKLRLQEPGTDARASHRDQYAWINVRGTIGPALFAQSVLSVATLDRVRAGSYDEVAGTERGTLEERRSARIASWKNDATLSLSPRNMLRAGFTAKRARARYDYEAEAHVTFTNFEVGGPPRDLQRSAHLRRSGSELSVYVADRLRLSDRLVVEAGLRAASESHTPDGTHLDPRVQVAWAPGTHTAVRAAWGVVHQPQRIDELQVEDGVVDFHSAQKAVHRVLSVEQRLPRGVHSRLELYDKSMQRVTPRFENLYDSFPLFPELRADRVRVAPSRGRARGAELLLRSDASAPLSAWGSYSLSSVTDEIDGAELARAWDQRHAATFSVNYRRGSAWNFNVAGTWHTGWPTTPVEARLENGQVVSHAGARSSQRLPAYSRLDFRATRTFRRVDFFVELFNVLNQSNPSRVNFFQYTVDANGQVMAEPVTDAVIGVLPSFGVTWRF